MMASEPAYERLEVNLKSKGYTSSYEFIQDDVMYIKMDDDIVNLTLLRRCYWLSILTKK